MPSAIGVAMISARIEEYSVPQMNGNAPNSPVTGFQMLVRQNAAPNAAIDGCDCRTSTAPIAHTSTMRTAANAPVPMRKPRSPPPRRVTRLPYDVLIPASAANSSSTTAAGSGA